MWLRYAENQIRVFGAADGVEHMQETLQFLSDLREAHEEDEHAFPTAYCIKLFEELNAGWVEQVRESRRSFGDGERKSGRSQAHRRFPWAAGPSQFPIPTSVGY